MYVSQRTISALISALIFAAASCLTIAAQNRSHISLPKPATTTSIIPIGSSLTFGALMCRTLTRPPPHSVPRPSWSITAR